MQYTIQLHEEILHNTKKVWVGVVDQNDVSSFGDTQEEALNMTVDALFGVLSVEAEISDEQTRKNWKTEYSPEKNAFTLTFPTYATNLQMNGSHKAHGEARVVA